MQCEKGVIVSFHIFMEKKAREDFSSKLKIVMSASLLCMVD